MSVCAIQARNISYLFMVGVNNMWCDIIDRVILASKFFWCKGFWEGSYYNNNNNIMIPNPVEIEIFGNILLDNRWKKDILPALPNASLLLVCYFNNKISC